MENPRDATYLAILHIMFQRADMLTAARTRTSRSLLSTAPSPSLFAQCPLTPLQATRASLRRRGLSTRGRDELDNSGNSGNSGNMPAQEVKEHADDKSADRINTTSHHTEEGTRKDNEDTSNTGKGLFRTMMDYPAKKEREKVTKRKQLEKEIGQLGRGSEVKEFMQTSGKLFIADEDLISAGTAPVFPKIEGETLAESHVNILAEAKSAQAFATLVGVSFNDHATSTVGEWINAYRDHFSVDASVFVCCCTNHWLLAWFGGMVRSTLRKQVPNEYHGSYVSLIDPKEVLSVQESLGIKNTLPSYVFLVDSNGLVRWRGTGSPTDTEIASLVDAGEELRRTRPDESLPKWQQVGSALR